MQTERGREGLSRTLWESGGSPFKTAAFNRSATTPAITYDATNVKVQSICPVGVGRTFAAASAARAVATRSANAAGNLHYTVFDMLWFKGKDRRDCPLSRRKRILSRLVGRTTTVLSPVFGRGCDPFRAVERLDLGGVAKRLADAYAPDTVWRNIRSGDYTQMERCKRRRRSKK